ncbi:MAG: 3-hydroxybutyryl-CoA dehydrogenase [Anaerolineaceae bacterium]|nr:3-hydroxybutyryl-CoA dehydrogenase [Anaerolineaceae bacterium]
MILKRIGVIGAGVMGIGVAQALAQTQHDVVLIDIQDDILAQAKDQIYQNIRLSRLFNTPKESDKTPDELISQINFTTDYQQLQDVDFVVENSTEKWQIKKEIYPQLDAICPPKTVFAANTSCISITRIGSVTTRPDRIVGMHFMNPVPMKPTVEVIRGYHTSDSALDIAQQFLAGMNKDCIVVNDSPGFVSNRVLMLTINEAAFLLHEGVSNAEDVDQIFKKCFGHKMGPLETADLIGLDTILYSIEVLHESFADSKYRPCPLLRKMVDAGLYGRKSGAGFYAY